MELIFGSTECFHVDLSDFTTATIQSAFEFEPEAGDHAREVYDPLNWFGMIQVFFLFDSAMSCITTTLKDALYILKLHSFSYR